LAYQDAQIWREAGQGGLEIRTFIALAGAAEGHTGELWFYAPIPVFAVGCTVAVMNLQIASAEPNSSPVPENGAPFTSARIPSKT
jgi:hypothetical protein